MSVIVIGSLNVDMVIKSDVMPKIGETLNGKNFFISNGGKGANQGVAIKKQGPKVKMIGAVGKDDFGKKLIDRLNGYDMDTSCVKEVNVNTGVALITVVDSDNFIIIDNGANYEIYPEDIEKYEDEIKCGDIMVLQLETKLETVIKSIEIAKKHNIKVIFNPAPARELPKDIYKSIDYLILNETELEILSEEKLSSMDEYKKGMLKLVDKGAKEVILTLGAKGVLYTNGKIWYELPSYKVNAVDTTSAGDAFIGGFVSRLYYGGNVEEAINYANAVAAITVTKNGAMDSIPYKDEVEKFII